MTSWFNPWLRFWSLKMELNGFPLQGAHVWVPNIWIPVDVSLSSMKTWVVEGVWHGENKISPHIFSIFKRLRIEHGFQKLICEVWSFWGKVIEPDQTVFHVSRAGLSVLFPKYIRKPVLMGQILWTQMLEATHNTRSLLSSSLHSYIPRAKQDCLNWPNVNRQSLRTPFVQMSERFETVFLSWEEGPVCISSCSSWALWAGRGTESWVIHAIYYSLWQACLLPWRNIKHTACWAVCTFLLPKSFWTDYDIYTTPSTLEHLQSNLFWLKLSWTDFSKVCFTCKSPFLVLVHCFYSPKHHLFPSSVLLSVCYK